MTPAGGAVLSLAYILGLLFGTTDGGKFVLLGLGILAAIVLLRFWRTGPKLRLWLAAILVGFLAPLYLQVRIPQPASNDISKFVPLADTQLEEQLVTVKGKVTSIPRLTRSQRLSSKDTPRAQFWLEAERLNQLRGSNNQPTDANSQAVAGKLYVTAPLLQTTGLYPGEEIDVTGRLYKPKPALNPGGFDFSAYLMREGVFAGLSGHQISLPEEQKTPPWGWWQWRSRIIRSQLDWLGSPEGQLVSSIAIGSKAVDLPGDLQGQFIQVGLAHALAASGLQVALILSVLLTLTRRFSTKAQLLLGTSALVMFVGLTGVQPAVMRAAFMGVGALVALVANRKQKPLGLLLLAATILLLLNPLWIWDLGFQLSFLATLGLLVTVLPVMKSLDWLPPAIAAAIAVPLAASLWTLPLQIYVFGLVAPYSLAANIIATPLIAIISLGGVVSALAALIWPVAGSALAWLLYYPTHWLIAIVKIFCWLPGNSLAVGKISLIQLSVVYGLIGLMAVNKWWQRRWWAAVALAVAAIAVPFWQTQATVFRATVLATPQAPVVAIQDRGKVLLINSGDADTANFTVLPFLQQQGVNQIDWGVALDSRSESKNGWLQLLKRLPIRSLYLPGSEPALKTDNQAIAVSVKAKQGTYQALLPSTNVTLNSTAMKLINVQPSLLQLEIGEQTWLLLGNFKPEDQKQIAKELSRVDVLCWSGETLIPELLDVLRPKVAIAAANHVDPETWQSLQKQATVYWTGRDGAVQWTPGERFESTLESTDERTGLL
jgi:competence protein ComEC